MSFETRSSLKAIAADLKVYLEKKIELTKLEAQDKGAVLAAAIMSNVLGIALLLVGVFLLLFAAAIGLGYLLDNMALGFSALALFFILVGTYIYNTKRNLIKKKLQYQIALFIQHTFDSATEDNAKEEQAEAEAEASTKASAVTSADEEKPRP